MFALEGKSQRCSCFHATQRLYLYGRASADDNEATYDNEEVHTHGPKSRVVGARQTATGEVGGCSDWVKREGCPNRLPTDQSTMNPATHTTQGGAWCLERGSDSALRA